MNFRLKQPLMMAAKIEEEPVSFEGLNACTDELQTIFSQMSKRRSDLSACIDELQNSVSEMLNLLNDETADNRSDAQKIRQWVKDMKDLKDGEKKLIEEFNKVMSNLYLLPGYILAASSGVSGLLSSDPHLCWLLVLVIAVVFVFLAGMGLAIRFAYRQLTGLKAKTKELVDERVRLRQCFQGHVRSFSFSLQESNPTLMTKMNNYEPKNPELDFQTQHYGKFLLLILVGGFIFAIMLLVAAYYVLCDSKSVPCTPCTLHTRLHSRLHSELQLTKE